MSLLQHRFLCSAVGTCKRYINVTAVRLDASISEGQKNSVFWIPRHLGGKILGKGGATIKDIATKTNSYINVDFNTVKDGNIPVTLRGTVETCTEAKDAIEQLLANHSETTIWVPEAQWGFIAGKGGVTIDTLKHDTHTWISVDNAGVKDGLVPVTIKGQVERCTEAKDAIEQLLADHSETTVWVPEARLGSMIGPGGAVMKSLKQDTGAYIRTNQDLIKDGLVPVTIKGPPKNCTEAKDAIEQLLADHSETTVWVPEAQSGRIFGKGGTVIEALRQDTHTGISVDKAGVKDGLIPVTIKGQVERCTEAKDAIEQLLADHSETTVWVPEVRLGSMIGPGGAVMKSLKQDTGAYIRTNQDVLIKDGLVPVTIKGPPKNCTEAKDAIEQLLANHSETTVWVPESQSGRIFGKGGTVIEALRQDTHTGISVDEAGVKDGLIPVTIKGQVERCTEAKDAIDKLLTNHSETTIWVPEAQWGMLVGKGGATIDTIIKNTHTWINGDKAGIKDGLVPVTIKGQVERCTEAKETIETIANCQ